jgi:hypothetical protein
LLWSTFLVWTAVFANAEVATKEASANVVMRVVLLLRPVVHRRRHGETLVARSHLGCRWKRAVATAMVSGELHRPRRRSSLL